jgi:hypothetical protein
MLEEGDSSRYWGRGGREGCMCAQAVSQPVNESSQVGWLAMPLERKQNHEIPGAVMGKPIPFTSVTVV